MPPITEFTGQYRFLSNFWHCVAGILLDGDTYPSVEHAFQAAKTIDLAEREKIRACEKPGDAKTLGRLVTLRPRWEQQKRMIMTYLVRQKFSRDPVLRQSLIQTGDAELVEGNHWNDTYWGMCNGVGQNWLGQILMLVRAELTYPSNPGIDGKEFSRCGR